MNSNEWHSTDDILRTLCTRVRENHPNLKCSDDDLSRMRLWNVMDSMEMLEFLCFLEETFHLSIEAEEVVPENFKNLETLSDWLLGKSQAVKGGVHL